MCGITIFLSKNKKNIIELIINSLYNIQNRGYDSVGISYLKNMEWMIQKYASTNNIDSFEILKNKLTDISSSIAIAHTRWATHGPRNDINAHPHISMNKKIIIVHNGIITNYIFLKNILIEKGYIFNSETDSEVIANLIEYELMKVNDINQAIKNTILELEGTWALSIIYTENIDQVYVTRHGSPLILGETENLIICVSEISGFIGLINNYIILDNNDIVILTKDGYKTNIIYNTNNIKHEFIENSPGLYKYWTLKEIYEQPLSINRAMNNGSRINNNKIVLRGLEYLNQYKKDIVNIIGLGCGTSYHATMLLKYYFNRHDNLNIVQSFDASEFNELDIPKKGKTLFIICSQSGETRDIINAIDICNIRCS
jgi:glucosamine--fructose-6-phosphate aminotransferase (isomerizing)